jgi:DNA-binding CsgD family transcriptional regulator
MVELMHEADRQRPEPDGSAPPRTVACVDVILRPGASPDTRSSAMGVAVERIRRSVRADDRICPIGVSRLAVEFGASAGGVLPQVLGERLARAVDQVRAGQDASAPVATSVGVVEPGPHPAPTDLTRRAAAAARAGTSLLAQRTGTTPVGRYAAVTVDRLVVPGRVALDALVSFQAIHHRSVRRLEDRRPPTAREPTAVTGPRPPAAHPADGPATTERSVLIVDPFGAADGTPGLAARAAAASAERSGFRLVELVVAPDDPPPTSVGDRTVDVAVVTLDGGLEHAPSNWASGTWGVPARITASFCAAGVPVLAMSVGAGAGALAGCVAQGAVPLASPDHLPSALRSLDTPTGDESPQGAELQLSEKFRALVGLTASERRVLYYLTEGWSAQDMTDELVVSLTTVRSHIRSVLRKLGVRSQLAAVALANSRDLRRDGGPTGP